MGSSPSVAELPGWARALLDDSRLAHLGLTDDRGDPRVLPVTFAVHGRRLVSAVDHKPKVVAPERLARVRWLRARPRAALTVDSYDEDWSRLAWVQALGEMAVLEASDAAGELATLTARYPQYRERPPHGPVLALTPALLRWWQA